VTKTILVCLLATILLATVCLAEAQQRGKVPRIGFLGNSTEALEENLIGPFREGLRDLGYVGNLVTNGGLASYGISYQRAGHVSAKYIQRILTGTNPKDLPVETIDKLDLVFNLVTAKQIGVTIPPNVLARADRVIK
jgi:hypothetical protein